MSYIDTNHSNTAPTKRGSYRIAKRGSYRIAWTDHSNWSNHGDTAHSNWSNHSDSHNDWGNHGDVAHADTPHADAPPIIP